MSFDSWGRRIHFGAEEQVQLEQGCQVQEEAVGDEADVVLAAVLQPVGPRATQASHARAGCLRTHGTLGFAPEMQCLLHFVSYFLDIIENLPFTMLDYTLIRGH